MRNVPNSRARRKAIISALLPGGLAVVLAMVCYAPDRRPHPDAVRSAFPVELRLHEPVTPPIPPLQTLVYSLPLNETQFARIEIDQSQIDLSIILVDPAGVKLAEYSNVCFRKVSLSVLSRKNGVYTISLKSRDNRQTGSCQVTFEEVRKQRPSDRDEVAAGDLLEDGQKLRADYLAESNRAAIKKFEAASTLYKRLGNKVMEATALRNKAEVLSVFGEFAGANRVLKEALLVSKGPEDNQDTVQALNGIAHNDLLLGKAEESLSISSQSLAICRKGGYRRFEAQALLNTGYAYGLLNNFDSGMKAYQGALAIFDELGDRRGRALTLTCLGVAYLDAGELATAFNYEQECALPLWQEIGDKWGQAFADNKLALILANQGFAQKALDLQRKALEIFKTIGDPEHQAVCLNSIGYILIGMNDLDQALSLYREADRLFQNTGDPTGGVAALIRIGKICELRHENAEALGDYGRCLALAVKLNKPRYQAYLWKWMGNIYMQTGLPRALSCYNRAFEIGKGINDPRGEAETLDGFGVIYSKMGKNREAVDYFQKALLLRREFTDREGESLTLYNLARAERDLGTLSTAKEHVEQALAITESLRRNVISLNLRASYFASVRNRYELNTDILMRLSQAASTGADGAQDLLVGAFESSEKSRSRSLLEMLAESRVDIKTGVDESLLQHEKELIDQMDLKEQRIINFLSAGKREAAAGIDAELEPLNSEYQRLQDQIKLASPKYAALAHPAPLSLNQIQEQVLDSDTLLLEYSLGTERSYLWAVNESDIHGYTLPPKREIEPLAKSVLELLRIAQPTPVQQSLYWNKAGLLSQILLGPVAASLRQKRIVVVADGTLQYLPFATLPLPARGQVSRQKVRLPRPTPPRQQVPSHQPVPMMAEHEVVSLPSASTLALLRQEIAGRAPAPKTVAAFANPVFDPQDARFHPSAPAGIKETKKTAIRGEDLSQLLRGGAQEKLQFPPLPSTQDEADAIEKLVPDPNNRMIAVGFAANRDAAMSKDLAQYRILHFATHALLDATHPDGSAIILSTFDDQGNPRNGVLNLRDIYNLNLPVELVVLSACDTALGKEVDGEGLVGLTRGFMFAGAPRIVASLWRVDDTAAAELMRRFYEKMLKENLRPAAALRAAQFEMWRDTAWKSPSYWGAFTLQGEWR